MLNDMKRGFTVVEILITLVVMGVLIGLGTVGMRSSLANANDAERKSDIEVIARGLEQRYNRGLTYNWQEDTNSDGTLETLTSVNPPGTYPGNNELWFTAFWSQRARLSELLPGVTQAAVTSPSGNGWTAACFFWFWEYPRCDRAEKDTTIQGYFDDGNGGWKDLYLYEFIGANGGYCNVEDCTRYNLYWISETDKTIYMGIPGLKVHRSRHQ